MAQENTSSSAQDVKISEQDLQPSSYQQQGQDVKNDQESNPQQGVENTQSSQPEQPQEDVVKNLEKAKEEALSKLQEIREQKKAEKSELEKLQEQRNQLTQETPDNTPQQEQSQGVQSQDNETLEFIKNFTQNVRQEAINDFYQKYPDVAENQSLRDSILTTYEKIKTSNQEVSKNTVLNDLTRAYYANVGPKLAEAQSEYDSKNAMIQVASRNTGDTDVNPSDSRVNVPRELKESADKFNLDNESLVRIQEKLKERGLLDN